MATLLVLTTLLVSGFAAAQNPASKEKTDPLPLVQIAANVASNAHQDLNGYIAIYVDSEQWGAGLADSDLGPFLKLKEQKPGRSAVLFLSSAKDAAVSVYFDGGNAFGITAAKAGASGKIEASEIAAGYKTVTKEMAKETGQEFRFEPGDISTDDGEPLTMYMVTSVNKKPAN